MCDTNTPDRPIPNSYWVRPGSFAAGKYPGASNPTDAKTKLRSVLDSGVDHFIDLTETRDGLEPYSHIAEEEARLLGKTITLERHPIVDVSIPQRPEQMTRILDAIDSALSGGGTVYVHCWGGVGRTGTVVGCWLVRHGLTGDEALAQIAEWWKGVEKSWRVRESPETAQQRDYVRRWSETLGEETGT